MLRAYDYAGDEVTLVHSDDVGLRRMAVFDVLINNADRKGGHILSGTDGHVYGVDHGVSLHVEDKLRTVLWGWAGKPVDDETLETITRLRDDVRGTLGEHPREHITGREVEALRRRAVALLENPVMPSPGSTSADPVARVLSYNLAVALCRYCIDAVGPVGAVGGVPVADHEMQVAQRRARHDVAAVQLAQGSGGAAVGRTAPR